MKAKKELITTKREKVVEKMTGGLENPASTETNRENKWGQKTQAHCKATIEQKAAAFISKGDRSMYQGLPYHY